MIPVPDGWLEQASSSHRPEWRARILTAAGAVAVDGLPVVGGQITRDEERNPRTTVNIDVPATAVPGPLDQSYLPTGGRLQVQYRIAPSPTWVTIADVDLVASALARPEDMWTLAGADRAARIALDDLGRGSVPAMTGTIGAAITALVKRTFPNDQVQVTGPAATLTVPDGYERTTISGSPWQLIERLAEDAESEVFYTTGRACVVRTAPDIAAPVDALAVGEHGQLTGYTINHQLAYNSVSLLYVNNDTGNLMIRGRWTDTRADSPAAVTRVGSEVVLTDTVKVDTAPGRAAADAAAAALGRRAGGRAREAELRHPTRPWLEPGDTIAVTYLGGPTESQIIRSTGIDLGPDNIQVTRLRNHAYRYGAPV